MNIFYHPVLGNKNISDMSLTSLLQLYLISSLVYYHLLDNIIEDVVYDNIAKTLLENYYVVEEVQQKWYGKILVGRGDLEAGTLYALRQKDYPDRVRIAADMWLRDIWDEGTKNGYGTGG